MQHEMRQIGPDAFPALLRQIPDAPKSLYIRGSWPTDEYIPLAVIGSRKMSAYGKRICEQLIAGLGGYPISIISGLALGIDSVAHEAALKAGLPTVAVLPSGLGDDTIYPSSHRGLAGRILDAGGALVSEYKEHDRPQEWSFAARNRIEAGLARAVLVIEAAERSGTSITTRLALDYNREVLAVPHPLGSETGAGTNSLIHMGAVLMRSPEDILEALGIQAEGIEHKVNTDDFSPDEKIVYEAMTEARERGVLQEETGLSQQQLNVAISLLVIKGAIREELGKLVRT